MKLNITINEFGKIIKKIPVDELKIGTVYRIKNESGPILLKINGGHPLILTFSSGDCWLDLSRKGSGNFADEPAIEILGQLTGIEITK